MYTQDFYIEWNVWNNAFSYNERENKRLFVPKMKKIQSLDEIQLLHSPLTPIGWGESEHGENKVTFEEYDFQGSMQQCFGLENLYELNWKWKKLYLVDNHNHVFYFWYLARSQEIISDGALLYHIDEHADTRDPAKYLLKPDSEDLQKVFNYTNFFLNVGNYIVPAEKEWLIGKTVQIRGEGALDMYNKWEFINLEKQGRNIILNLDLDFFEPELNFIDYDLKKKVILDIAKKADLITVCTSPYFIDQKRALDVFKDLFDFIN